MNGTAITNRLQNSFKIKDNNVYGSSYYWNFRTSSFKQAACLILLFFKFSYLLLIEYWYKMYITPELYIFFPFQMKMSDSSSVSWLKIIMYNIKCSQFFNVICLSVDCFCAFYVLVLYMTKQLPPQYNWNIVDSGVKHHNTKTII